MDRFGPVASAYATFRPRYPSILYERLAALTTGHAVAWDCGTGSGQAAVGVSAHFGRVLATDTSLRQLGAAARNERIRYILGSAERAPIAAASVDLVTVAQALHWFDAIAFYGEVRRVLAPGGVLAVWTYSLPTIEPALDEGLRHYHSTVVGPWWPRERRHVETGYDTIPFPFEPIAIDPVDMHASLTLADLVGYVGTWSATTAFREDRGQDPLVPLRRELARHWGDPESRRNVRWPLVVKAGRPLADH